MMNVRLMLAEIISAMVMAIGVSPAVAADGTWGDSSVDGNWSDSTKWVSGTIADGADYTATFDLPTIGVAESPLTVTVDSNRTIGNITVNNLDTADPVKEIAIEGSGVLTMSRTDATRLQLNIAPGGSGSRNYGDISAVIGGSDGLQKVGDGCITLSGQNTFTGGYAMKSGTTYVGADSTLDGGGNLISGPLGVGDIIWTDGYISAPDFGPDITIYNDIVTGVNDPRLGRRGTCGILTFAGDWTMQYLADCRVYRDTVISGSIGEATPGLEFKVEALVGGQKLTIAGDCTYTGQTYIKGYSQLTVNGDISSSNDVLIRKGSTLSGYGTVSMIHARQASSDPVWVNVGETSETPTSTPTTGIMTADCVDVVNVVDETAPTDRMGFVLEFSQIGSPDYTNAADSGNDVLHLTGDTPFIDGGLDSLSEIAVYFNVASLSEGDAFRGGFFIDGVTDFLSDVKDATYKYYVRGDGNGGYEMNGVHYYTVSQWQPFLPDIAVSTVAQTGAAFATGAANGAVMQFQVVPEPSSLVLLIAGLAAFAWFRRE